METRRLVTAPHKLHYKRTHVHLSWPKEAHLEVFEHDVREVGPLGKPAVWDNLGLQPLDHTAPQLVAVSSVAHHCGIRDG